MARTVDDVLSRRTRATQLDAAAARRMAPEVAALMAAELGYGEDWRRRQIAEYEAIVVHYMA
jgi:glycerol-3-phosphate dehydrogenase